MPTALIWLAVAGVAAYTVKQTDEALDAGTRFVLAGAAAGGVYIVGKRMGAW